jgi:hypothetical protein
LRKRHTPDREFLRTRGLLAINNYSLYIPRAFRELKSKVEGRIVLFACDYTPLDYENYFREMLDGLSPKGLVIDSQYSPVVGLLKGGKYEAVRRDLQGGRQAVYDFLCRYWRLPRH